MNKLLIRFKRVIVPGVVLFTALTGGSAMAASLVEILSPSAAVTSWFADAKDPVSVRLRNGSVGGDEVYFGVADLGNANQRFGGTTNIGSWTYGSSNTYSFELDYTASTGTQSFILKNPAGAPISNLRKMFLTVLLPSGPRPNPTMWVKVSST